MNTLLLKLIAISAIGGTTVEPVVEMNNQIVSRS